MFRWLLLLLVTGSGYAAHPGFLLPFLGGDSTWPTHQVIRQMSEWINCSDDATLTKWCSDEFRYYKLKVWGEVKEDAQGNIASLTLNAPYSSYNWSQFQLALRKDGFKINHITIGDAQFSVAEELLQSTHQQVDKSLVLFLNQSRSQFPKRIDFQYGQVIAKLETDGDEVYLKFA